ncbi:hypothetical protein Tco_1090166 [Tanacetum coccineum]|uniref:Uncharacterized protein n=1 Tax=Tanacetum coccineum TaxID=301880 RepID=A0ABQ5I3L3_9ASTR
MEGSLYSPNDCLMNNCGSEGIKDKNTCIIFSGGHVADFHYMDDARDIWNAVKARFGGNAESKKMRKSMKQEFSEFRKKLVKQRGLNKGYDRNADDSKDKLNQLKAKQMMKT